MSSTSAAPPAVDRPGRGRLIAWFALPVFFVIGFPLAYVSALHAPSVNGIPVVVAGAAEEAAQVSAPLAGAGFVVTTVADAATAADQVRERQVEGAVVVDLTAATPVTVYTASAAGRAVASAVESAGVEVAQALGATADVEDLVPTVEQDPLGSNLFYLLIFSSIGGYLVIITISELWGPSLKVRLVGALVTSVVTPPVVFGLSALVVGGYGADALTLVTLLGVVALYVWTCATAAVLVEQLLGPAITLGVIAVVVFLNFPSSGGGVPASMLPDFWQGLHSFWFGAGAMEAFRSVVYFDGAGAGRWVGQLAAWALALPVVVAAVHLGLRRRRAPAPPGAPPSADEHVAPGTRATTVEEQ